MDTSSFLDLDINSVGTTTPNPLNKGSMDDIMSSIFDTLPAKEKKVDSAVESIFGTEAANSPLISYSPTIDENIDNNNNNNNIINNDTISLEKKEDDIIVVTESVEPELEPVDEATTTTTGTYLSSSPPPPPPPTIPIENIDTPTTTTVADDISLLNSINNIPIVVNPLEVEINTKVENSDDDSDEEKKEEETKAIVHEIFTPIVAMESNIDYDNNYNLTPESLEVTSIKEEQSNSNIVSSQTVGTIEQEVYEKPEEPVVSPLLSEFNKIFFSTIPLEKSPLEILKMNAFTGALKYSPLRGIAWKIFLGGLDINRIEYWEKDITQQRKRYEKLKEEHCFDPRNSNSTYDPLSQNDDSPWNKFFKNLDVQKIIKIDLERTHPDNDFFSNPIIRETMLRILFVYSKTNGIISYRQGMHELLAPIIYLYNQEYSDYKKLDQSKDDTLVDFIYNIKYLEHDTFAIFERLMKFTSDWYSPAPPQIQKPQTTQTDIPNTATNTTPTTTTPLTTSPNIQRKETLTEIVAEEEEELTPSKCNDVVQKCKYIHSVLLKQKDNELYQHLDSLDIEPQIYLLRWIRLLFGREFHFDDVLNIWDALFAYGDNLILIDYFCISMLTYIREHLLKSDSIYALKRIYKYPPVEDVYMLIKKSLELKDSNCPIAVMVKTAQPPITNSLVLNSNIITTNTGKSLSSSTSTTAFPDTTAFESSTTSFQPYSSQLSSSNTTPIDPLGTTPLISNNIHITTPISSNNNNGSNTPLSLSSNNTTTPSTPNILNTSTTFTNITTTTTTASAFISSSSLLSSTSTSTTSSPFQSSTNLVQTKNTKDIFANTNKEADLFNLFSTATTLNTSTPNLLLSSSNPTISIGQARLNSYKHKSINLTSSPFSTNNNSNDAITKLKNNQIELGNQLKEILPFLEKGKSYLINNNSNNGEESLSKSEVYDFINAIEKVKQIQDTLLSSNNNNE